MKYLILIFFLFFSSLFASDLKVKSSENKVSLIELYTSQGCSSCPPADKWLSSLKNKPNLFKDFIPLAFHVTYWDFIGWKDIFANKQNDERQRNYSLNIWNKNSVYTPQFVINSNEYRHWFRDKGFPKFKKEYGGVLSFELKNQDLDISFFNKNIKNKKLIVNIAVLGFDYDIHIKKGENSSKTLKHDFVVLKHIKKQVFVKNNTFILKTQINHIEDDKKHALVVWVGEKNKAHIQAVGAYL